MTAWSARSRIPAAYLNPAFVAAVIAASAEGHAAEPAGPMPWHIPFIVGPLILHKPTREALPSTVATHFSTWVTKNPLLRAGFPDRATALAPNVREGLRFGVRHGLLRIDQDRVVGSIARPSDPDLRTLLNRARFVGKWLAGSGRPATVFAILGVEP